MPAREIPILGALNPGTKQRHLVKLPGAALADDEPRPVVTVAGAKAGPILFVNAGVHGGEYPAIESVIRLGTVLDPQTIAGTVVLMPVLNLPAFRTRTPFVCPVDGINPNRVFPGEADGSYSEQMVHALMSEFVAHADAYIDIHGGDIPESLVPFVICRGGSDPIDTRSKEMTLAFGLPYVLTVSKPVQVAKGASSYAAGAAAGVPSILAEAGGVGQMQEAAVALLVNGVARVMQHLGMIDSAIVKTEGDELKATPTEQKLLNAFEWMYAPQDGMWYPAVAAGDQVHAGQEIGVVRDLFGDVLENFVSPADGVVLFLTINPSVRKGGVLMGIGVS
jgi:predicted deacylase